ncbi:MAG TPA: helix-turn-helix domain-containing protein [Ktedonobacteraceae bacterium]
MAEKHIPDRAVALEDVSGYLSIKEAARIIGVSERSIYGYLQAGKLPGEYIGTMMMVRAEQVYAYERTAPGRKRTRTPRWRTLIPTKRITLERVLLPTVSHGRLAIPQPWLQYASLPCNPSWVAGQKRTTMGKLLVREWLIWLACCWRYEREYL